MKPNYMNELIERYPQLQPIETDVKAAYDLLEKCYREEGKLLIAGNGGSSSDAEHIVGELMKGFVKTRKMDGEFADKLAAVEPDLSKILIEKLQGSLPAIALSGHPALTTAYLNDVDGKLCFAQQTYGYGKAGDVLLAISTSGNSKNVLYALVVAKAKGMKVIGLTGGNGGRLKELADVTILVPETETYKIQELHLPIYHALCLMLEERFFS